jgi:hypothetical protein
MNTTCNCRQCRYVTQAKVDREIARIEQRLAEDAEFEKAMRDAEAKVAA